ncbi:MAG: beta-galactosidase, partial [Bacteroidetes bacterium]|nr:beta-galactosidase [Bacteroidota bacterium]
MRTRSLCFCLTLLIISLSSCKESRNKYVIDLSGDWEFRIDSLDQGVTDNWVTKTFIDQIQLPGSMLTNGKGDDITVKTKWTAGIWDSIWYKSPDLAKYREPGNIKVSFFLQPLKHYVGVAWYRKKVIIPARWEKRYTEMFLERCHWESTVWVDTQKVGMQNALSAPHLYDLSQYLTPGEHMLTVRIDNRIKDIDPGIDAHSVTDNTQTNWNGIIGAMRLISRPSVYISHIQLYPDVDKKMVRARIEIRNISGKEADYRLTLSATPLNPAKGKLPASLNQSVHIDKDTTVVDLLYPMGEHPLLWDEFEPNLYSLKAGLHGERGDDVCLTVFGMRKFEIKGTQFWMNGRPIFLRGTLECAIFPKTGYPSVAVDDWMHIFQKCKAYGLNHMRFHSWCPPEAAFIAADRMGIYLSVENSAWAHLGGNTPIDQYVFDESNRIVRHFGNHPSFCLMPYGNEASGDSASAFLARFIQYWKARDNRRFYTSASGFPSSPASDYTSSGAARIQWWAAGLSSLINAGPPTSDYDWTPYIEKDKPTVSHEIGQWCVYPDFKEMSKYDGVLKPRNFEIFQEKLQENGMASLADSFLLASGKLQVLCYKADIEAAFRTPGFAGFQLLDLHDFPGQGTALVGVLNAFWEEKGYISPKEYSRFCCSTVPLLRMEKMIYLNNEVFNAKAGICHYGKASLENITAA